MNKKELTVKHHDREVSVTYYTPENMENYPVVILSHGYNGHQTDFALTCEYFANSGIASWRTSWLF